MKDRKLTKVLSLVLCIGMFLLFMSYAMPVFATDSDVTETALSAELKSHVGDQAVFDWAPEFLLIDENTLKNSTLDDLFDYYYDNIFYSPAPSATIFPSFFSYTTRSLSKKVLLKLSSSISQSSVK